MGDNSAGSNIWGYDTRVVSATLSRPLVSVAPMRNPYPYTHLYTGSYSGLNPTKKTYSLGLLSGAVQHDYYDSLGNLIGSSIGSSSTYTTTESGPNGDYPVSWTTYSNWDGDQGSGPWYWGYTIGGECETFGGAGPKPDPWSNPNLTYRWDVAWGGSGSWSTPISYSDVYAADVAAGVSGTYSVLYLSDKHVVSKVQKVVTSAGPELWVRYEIILSDKFWSELKYSKSEWYANSSTFVYEYRHVDYVSVDLPDSCIGPWGDGIPPAFAPASGVDESSLTIDPVLRDITDKLSLPADQVAFGFEVSYTDTNTYVVVPPIKRYITYTVYRWLETQGEADAEDRARRYEYLYQAEQSELLADWLTIRDEIDLVIRTTRATFDPDQPPSQPVIDGQYQLHVDWYADQDALRLRRNAFFLDSSNRMLAQFVAYVPEDNTALGIPVAWSLSIKSSSLWSDYVYREVPLIGTKTEVVTTPSPDVKVTTRTVTMSYEYPKKQPDGTETIVVVTQVQVGKKTETDQWHTYQNTPKYAKSIITDYENWILVPDELTGVSVPVVTTFVDYQLIAKNWKYGQYAYFPFPGSIVNGRRISGYGHYLIGDSKYGPVPNDPKNVMHGYSPPYPNASSTLRYETSNILRDYLRDIPLLYDEGKPVSVYRDTYNSSHMWQNMVIEIVLYGPAGKGIYGEWEITDVALDIFGTLICSYNHRTAEILVDRWVPATKETVDTPHGKVPKPLTVFRGPGAAPLTTSTLDSGQNNSLILFRGIKWPDVKRKAKQRWSTFGVDREKPVEHHSIEYLVLSSLGRM